MRTQLGMLVAVGVLVGAGWMGVAQAATPVENKNLNINVTVTVAALVRIEWGVGSTLAAPNAVTDAAWSPGMLAYGGSASSFSLTPTPPATGVLTVANTGYARVDVTAIVSSVDTVTPVVVPPHVAWTVSAAGPGKDIYAIKLTPTASALGSPVVALQDLNATAPGKGIITGFKKSHGVVTIVLDYRMPDDTAEEFDGAPSVQHVHVITLSASAA